jgi:hypothetical protein
MKRRLWVAYGVLLVGAVWFVLTATGEWGVWAKGLSEHLPPLLVMIAIFAIPVLAALCSLHLRIDWRARIALYILLLLCVPFLTVALDGHPLLVALVVAIFVVEEFGIIPLINRRLISRN